METSDSERLTSFLTRHARIAVLTGAGCSTASGIPEYRDDDGAWRHAPPVQYADFLASDGVRQRYWARSFVGWRCVHAARPNAAHRALACLDRAGRIEGLITQNVDNLHRRAGSRSVLDLHGVLQRVRCLACGTVATRTSYQARLAAANPGCSGGAGALRPDGDVELAGAGAATFRVPACARCGGIVKPDVVFFGESVPPARVRRARGHVTRADALLVVGSSLMVFSGYRFVREARAAGKPVAILNRGRTRADVLATLRLGGDCSDVLAAVAEALCPGSAVPEC